MNNRGFTLMELVVTVALLAIMMAIALPATSGWRKSAQYKEAAREVVSVLRRARSIAVRQNQSTAVTIDLTNRKYSLAGAETKFPQDVTVESKRGCLAANRQLYHHLSSSRNLQRNDFCAHQRGR